MTATEGPSARTGTTGVQPARRGARLTERELAALRLFETEGECNEGMIANLWPLVRNARLVINSLEKKRLVSLGTYWGDDVGYELKLTEAGRGVLRP
jgi:hypothetical protein